MIYLGDHSWEHAKRAIPSPRKYKAIYNAWVKATNAVGAGGLWLHDLCHHYAQLPTEGGRPEVARGEAAP